MDFILHVFGVCNDAHIHVDVIDVLILGSGASPLFLLVKYKIRTIINKLKKEKV